MDHGLKTIMLLEKNRRKSLGSRARQKVLDTKDTTIKENIAKLDLMNIRHLCSD